MNGPGGGGERPWGDGINGPVGGEVNGLGGVNGPVGGEWFCVCGGGGEWS